MYTNAQRRSNVRRRETGEGREGEMEGEVEEGGGVMKFGKVILENSCSEIFY